MYSSRLCLDATRSDVLHQAAQRLCRDCAEAHPTGQDILEGVQRSFKHCNAAVMRQQLYTTLISAWSASPRGTAASTIAPGSRSPAVARWQSIRHRNPEALDTLALAVSRLVRDIWSTCWKKKPLPTRLLATALAPRHHTEQAVFAAFGYLSLQS